MPTELKLGPAFLGPFVTAIIIPATSVPVSVSANTILILSYLKVGLRQNIVLAEIICWTIKFLQTATNF